MSQPTELLKVPEFADRLRIKPSCARRWILEKKVAVVRVGRLVRIPLSELERIIQAGTTPANPRQVRGH